MGKTNADKMMTDNDGGTRGGDSEKNKYIYIEIKIERFAIDQCECATNSQRMKINLQHFLLTSNKFDVFSTTIFFGCDFIT